MSQEVSCGQGIQKTSWEGKRISARTGGKMGRI